MRTKGEGSLYQRKSDGLWIGQVVVGYRWVEGTRRQVTRTVSDKDRTAALLKWEELKRAVGQGAAVSPQDTVGRLLDAYLAHKRVTLTSPRSIESIATTISLHLLPTLGPLKIAKVGPRDVERLMVRIGRVEGKARTALVARSVLRAAWNWGRRQRWFTLENPAADADPGVVNYRPKAHATMSAAQVRTVMAADHPLRSLWIVAMASGMRISELLALTWADVDLHSAVVRVPGTKTRGAAAPILLPSYAVAALKAHYERHEADGTRPIRRTGLVWHTRTGAALDRRNAARWWRKHIADLGLPPVTLHEMARHTYAQIAREQGVPVSAVQAVLRHAQLSTTSDIYGAARTLTEQQLAVDALERLFGG